MVEARLARAEEIPELLGRIAESGGVYVDLWRTPVWVAVEAGADGKDRILGLLAAELVWQMEPLLVFGQTRASRRRACWVLYRAAEAWMRDPSRNRTGVHTAFATLRRRAVRGWARKMGWLHQFRRAPVYVKYFQPKG